MEQVMKIIVFKLNEQSFGVEVNQVVSIERLQSITEVPGTSDFIKGVIPLRGEITPVLDLKERLSMKQITAANPSLIMIIIIDDIQIGLIVDDATEVRDIDSSTIQSPSKISGVDETFIRGIAKVEDHLLILLDLENVTDQNETLQLKEVVND